MSVTKSMFKTNEKQTNTSLQEMFVKWQKNIQMTSNLQCLLASLGCKYVLCVCTHTHTHTYARTHARTHAHTHTHTHVPITHFYNPKGIARRWQTRWFRYRMHTERSKWHVAVTCYCHGHDMENNGWRPKIPSIREKKSEREKEDWKTEELTVSEKLYSNFAFSRPPAYKFLVVKNVCRWCMLII